MNSISLEQALVILSALAGAAHVLAPDHWMPASVLAWQRRWNFFKMLGFALWTYALHIISGFLIFLLCIHFFRDIAADNLLGFSLVLMLGVTFFRARRFTEMKEIHRTAHRNRWAVLGVVSLLGPCESVIPIFIKADQLGVGFLLPFLAFFLGTLIAGSVAIAFGRFAWNKPFWLPRGMNFAHQKMAAIPVVAVVAIGLSFLFRLSV